MYLLVLGTGWSSVFGYFGPIRFMPKLKAGLIYVNLFVSRFLETKKTSELKTLELWILRLILDFLFSLIFRLIQYLVWLLKSVKNSTRRVLYAESLEPPIRSREILNLTHHLLRELSLAGMWLGYPKREKKRGLSRKLNMSTLLKGYLILKFPALILPFLHNIFNTSYFPIIFILYTSFLSSLL